jgi:alpha-beta hydrolase superfamily lysophospholipase
VESIQCPTLLTHAENDPLSTQAATLFEALRCPKKALINFTASEGADTHVEQLNRSVLNSRVFDWLDEIFEMA